MWCFAYAEYLGLALPQGVHLLKYHIVHYRYMQLFTYQFEKGENFLCLFPPHKLAFQLKINFHSCFTLFKMVTSTKLWEFTFQVQKGCANTCDGLNCVFQQRHLAVLNPDPCRSDLTWKQGF